MSGNEIRNRFLKFFKERGHTIVPSAPLVPENDPSVLFNTAGMQPLVPYLMGETHPSGSKRIANVQKCVRTNDIDEVGDKTHLTFFEMLGNWSLGDYFKKEAIQWSFEFLTSKIEGLGLDPKRLYITVFEGDESAPRDEEAYQIWKEIFEEQNLDPEKRIFFMGADSNWWSPGDNGPCGPDSEMFYDITGTLTEGLTHEEFVAADDRQDVVEIWNDVFMEYEKKDGKVRGRLEQKNVDTGAGFERVAAIVQGVRSPYETDLFAPIMSEAKTLANDERSQRIISDHMRASVFLMADGISPSNTDQGYVLRRLLRRSMMRTEDNNITPEQANRLLEAVIQTYEDAYPNLRTQEQRIKEDLHHELFKFRQTLTKGLREFEKFVSAGDISGNDAFILFSTHGFPLELTLELALERGVKVDEKGFAKEMERHQELSRAGAEQKFKGGLADHSEKVVQYHTATHLLLAGLRRELGKDVHQAGSNITGERLRFDFTYPEKVDGETLNRVEQFVNEAIAADAKVATETMDKDEAQNDPSVEGSFWEKYPDTVTVYTVITASGEVLSRELCGGPHVTNTGEIKGTFKIIKEESSSAGVRRVKAVLE